MKSCYSPGDLLRVRGPYQGWNLPIQSVAPPKLPDITTMMFHVIVATKTRHRPLSHGPNANHPEGRPGWGRMGWEMGWVVRDEKPNSLPVELVVFPYIYWMNYQMSIDVNTRWAQKPIISRSETTPLCGETSPVTNLLSAIYREAHKPVYNYCRGPQNNRINHPEENELPSEKEKIYNSNLTMPLMKEILHELIWIISRVS